jgi:mono/diheme cytochrome c family protein
MKTTFQKPVFMTFLIICGAFILMSLTKKTELQTKPWIAPKEADALINPEKGKADATAEGKKLYIQYCVVCHGDKGKGNGVAAGGLTPKPADHSSQKCQSQTDGAIYWKMTEGRPPMAAYKGSLKDEQRWSLVNYIRTLAAKGKETASK